MSKSHPLNYLGKKGIRMTHLVLEDDCGLDAESAKFVGQLLFWSVRTNDPGGWVAKTYAEWEADVHIKERTLRRKLGQLAAIGVEKSVHRSHFYHYKPVLHCRFNWDTFYRTFPHLKPLEPPGTGPDGRSEPDKVAGSINQRLQAENPATADDAAAVGSLGPLRVPRPVSALPKRLTKGSNGSAASTGTEPTWEWLTERYGFATQLGDLRRFGYDDRLNPPDPRLPEPGEPERILRAKFGKMKLSIVLKHWLSNGALTVPAFDIQVAVHMLTLKQPDLVERIVSAVGQMRKTAQAAGASEEVGEAEALVPERLDHE